MELQLTQDSSYEITSGIISIFPNSRMEVSITMESIGAIITNGAEITISTYAHDYVITDLSGKIVNTLSDDLNTALKEWNK